MTYRRFCNMTGATCGARTAYPFGVLEFTLDFSGVRAVWSLVVCVVLCLYVLLSCFVIYCLIFIDLQLLITPFGKFKLFTRKLSLLQVVFYVKQCDSANRRNSLTNLQSALVMSPLSEVLLCARCGETVSYFYSPELITLIIFNLSS